MLVVGSMNWCDISWGDFIIDYNELDLHFKAIGISIGLAQ